MEVHNHRLIRDVAVAARFAASSHTGGTIAPPAQIESTLECGLTLFKGYPLTDILGHDDIAPGRKSDPEPDFPLESMRARKYLAPVNA